MLEIREVSHTFSSGVLVRRYVQAVHRVSFTLERGKILGLAGNSGCGKTTLSRMALGVLRPQQGQVLLEGRDIYRLPARERKQYHRRVQIIFQNPEASLNPAQRIGTSLLEPMRLHRTPGSRREQMEKIRKLLGLVGLGEELLERYPHQISGGEAQRIIICRALTLDPEVLVLDEPTSMLDVSVQAHILNLLKDLQKKLGLSYLFITHDIELAKWFADDLMIMKSGEIVEQGPAAQVLENPKHAYTRQLIENFQF